MPDKLPRYFELIREKGLSGDFVVFSTALSCREDRRDASLFPPESYQGESIAEFVLSPRGGAQTSTLLLPSALAKRVQFDASLQRHQDYDFCMRLEEAGASFHHIERPLSYWYQRGTLLSKGNTFEYCTEWLSNNKNRISRRAYVAYVEKELLAAARGAGRYTDFLVFVNTHLTWSERTSTLIHFTTRLVRKTLREYTLRAPRPSSAELLRAP